MKKVIGRVVIFSIIFQFFLFQNVQALDAPYIQSVTPQAIIPGQTITLVGSNFGRIFWDDSLYLGDTEITRASWSDTNVQFTAPSSILAGGKISIRSCDTLGESCSNFSEIDYYLQPSISSTDYSSVEIGDTLHIYGSQFEDNFPVSGKDYSLQVFINGKAIGADNIVKWESDEISIIIPSWATSGNISLTLSDVATGDILEATGSEIQVILPSANDEYSALQQYIQQTGIDEAWDYTTGSAQVIVAVIDSGVDTNHIELTDNIWKNTDEIAGNGKDDDKNGYIDDTHGYDFVANRAELTPYDGHGTMVAGIIGAVGNNSIGVTGINWDIQIMPLIALDRSGGSIEKINKAIIYATDNGADIINLSLGGAGWTDAYSDDFDAAIQYAFDNNVLIVAAAGNGDMISGTGVNLDVNPNSPVCNDGGEDRVLGVGSVDSSGIISTFSDYGSNCVDVMAPGENIISLSPLGYSAYDVPYDLKSGTSFSAPIVSGIAALIKARYPTMTNIELQERITRTATNINGLNSAYSGRMGSGLVNASLAVSQSYTAKVVTEPVVVDYDLTARLLGRVLLQVEQHGEAWYVYPSDSLRYYMKDGNTAYDMMRSFGLGITDKDLATIPSVEEAVDIKTAKNVCATNKIANQVKGTILLQVEQHGEAWYVDPTTCTRVYMKDGSAAYSIMRELGLGITDADLAKMSFGTVD